MGGPTVQKLLWRPLVKVALEGIFGKDNALRIIEFYKGQDDCESGITGSDPCWPKHWWHTGIDLFSRIITDYLFRCASEQWAAAAQRAPGGGQGFVYRYQHVLSNSVVAALEGYGLPPVCTKGGRTCHMEELPFVFDWDPSVSSNVTKFKNISFTAEERTMARSFGDYWTSFATHGHPNANDQPIFWPEFDGDAREGLVLTTPGDPRPNTDPAGIRTENSVGLCSFWDTVGYAY